jgi:hypothetical protein
MYNILYIKYILNEKALFVYSMLIFLILPGGFLNCIPSENRGARDKTISSQGAKENINIEHAKNMTFHGPTTVNYNYSKQSSFDWANVKSVVGSVFKSITPFEFFSDFSSYNKNLLLVSWMLSFLGSYKVYNSLWSFCDEDDENYLAMNKRLRREFEDLPPARKAMYRSADDYAMERIKVLNRMSKIKIPIIPSLLSITLNKGTAGSFFNIAKSTFMSYFTSLALTKFLSDSIRDGFKSN